MVKNTAVHLASESRYLLLKAGSELLDGRESVPGGSLTFLASGYQVKVGG